MKETTPYSIPKEPGRWRAILLAALVHLLLFVFFWIGIRWHNEQPVTVEAEVWDPQVRTAAPRPQPLPQPEPQPEPKPEPRPVPAPIAKPAPPPPEVEKEPPVKKPDIALEQEKKRKALEEKKRLEQEREEKQKQLELQRRLEQEKKEKADRERIAKEKAEKEKAAKEKAERERIEQAKAEAEQKRLAAEQSKKAAAERKRKEEAEKKQKEAAEAEMLAKIREAEMRRIAGAVTGTGGTGDAPKSQGPRTDPGYLQRVGAKIKSNTIFNADGINQNSPVEYSIELLPDGSLRGAPRKLKSSGVPSFDEAVRRAIEMSQPYPPDKSGSVPPNIVVSHKPKDQ